MFAFFNHNKPNYYHFFSACFCCYVFGHSLEFYLLCNMKFTRIWLESFLEEDFLPKNLGDHLCGKPFVMLLRGVVMICGVEFISLYIGECQNQIEMENLATHYKAIFGPQKDWDVAQIQKYCEISSDIILSNTFGLISKVMTCLFK